jgi:hypothetical protein
MKKKVRTSFDYSTNIPLTLQSSPPIINPVVNLPSMNASTSPLDPKGDTSTGMEDLPPSLVDWHGWDDPVADIEDGDSDSDDSLSPFSEDGLGATIPVIIPTSQSTTKFPNSNLRSYWKKATTDKKVKMNNHGFQMLRNIQEVKASEAVHHAQHKVSHLRAQA